LPCEHNENKCWRLSSHAGACLPATSRRALVVPARVRFVSPSFEREFRSERGTSRSRVHVVSSGPASRPRDSSSRTAPRSSGPGAARSPAATLKRSSARMLLRSPPMSRSLPNSTLCSSRCARSMDGSTSSTRNAGIAKLGSVAETTEEVFDDILDASFRGAYFTVQNASPLLSDGGTIVFTTSRHWQGVADPRCQPVSVHRSKADPDKPYSTISC